MQIYFLIITEFILDETLFFSLIVQICCMQTTALMLREFVELECVKKIASVPKVSLSDFNISPNNNNTGEKIE